MNQKNEFKPYVSAEKITPELTVTSIIMGIILAVVFGAANAYLGLRVGMTVSASIPAAVISMGVIRVIMRKNSILESNLVQTIGSAGESLAAGAIFTLPALFMWAKDSSTGIEKPSFFAITIIALIGGLLGVFFMVPLRNALIVREHNTLPYPEGQACAEVLLAGEEGGANAGTVFAGLGIAAAFKFFIDGLKLVPSEINVTFGKVTEAIGAKAGEIVHKVTGYPGTIGAQIYPAVMSVGYICGPRISSYMFSGGVVAWMVLIPLMVILGADHIMYPEMTKTIGQVFMEGGAGGVWGSYVRYIGAGALAAGGIISLVKSLPLIVRTFRDSIKSMKGGIGGSQIRTDKDIDMKIIIAAIVVLTLLVWLVPVIPVNIVAAIIIVVFGFFFATVSSRMVGIVGSSNNPVSGMAIATLLFSTLILTATSGDVAADRVAIMTGAIAIGSIICIIAAIAGDTSQDLKTGYLLGATPWKQQVGEVIGVVASAFAIGGVLYLLDAAWSFGGAEIPAPQATLMKMIIEGVVDQQLPWGLVLVGVVLAVVIEILGIPVLPFAIGVYLPVQLNACIMVGGLIRLFFNKMKNKNKDAIVNDGVLYCSGMIAGEGLVGILLAVFAIVKINGKTLGDIINLSRFTAGLPNWAAQLTSLATFALMIVILLSFTLWKKRKNVAKSSEKDAE